MHELHCRNTRQTPHLASTSLTHTARAHCVPRASAAFGTAARGLVAKQGRHAFLHPTHWRSWGVVHWAHCGGALGERSHVGTKPNPRQPSAVCDEKMHPLPLPPKKGHQRSPLNHAAFRIFTPRPPHRSVRPRACIWCTRPGGTNRTFHFLNHQETHNDALPRRFPPPAHVPRPLI